MRLSVTLFLALSLSLVALPIGAQQGGASAMQSPAAQKMIEQQLAKIPTGEEGVKQILGELVTRLKLEKDQTPDVKSVVQDSVAFMEKAVARFRSGELAAMPLMMQLQMAGKRAAVQIEPLLDDTQLQEYKKMQLEQRQQMMREMMKNQAAMAAAAANAEPPPAK